MNKLIIYGDIHGCYDEFISLRNQINPQKDDIEVCVGDIITKGKNSIKTLNFIIENKIKSVLGNHEDKLLRYLKHQKANPINPIYLNDDEQDIVNTISLPQINFLSKLPLFLKFGDITVLHAGVLNSMSLEHLSKHEIQKILRLRYLDKSGKPVMFGKETKDSIFWADIYNGKQGFIVYGHQHFDDPKVNQYSIGIDTGCVYGNRLSAAVFYKTVFPLEYQIYSHN